MEHVRHLLRRHPPPVHDVFRGRVLALSAVTLVADTFGTLAMYLLEKGADDGKINAFTDALFFSTVQLLTVSSQMPNPVTGPGRVVDVVLEIVALFVVTGLAGSFASFYFHLGKERS
jgi:hypothetical protein